MTVTLVVFIAIASPILLAGALLPPLLLHDRMQTLSGKFPEGLRRTLGLGREYRFSAWELFVFLLLSLSALTPAPVQQSVTVGSAFLLTIYAAFRMRTYLKARRDFFGELDAAARRLSLMFGVMSGCACLVFAVLSIVLLRS